MGQKPKERIEQVFPGHDDQRDCSGDESDRAQSAAEISMRARALREQRQRRQQRHDRHVLEQEDGKGALAIVELEMAALVQNLERDGGRRHRQRESRNHGSTGVDQAGRIGECPDRERGEHQLQGAEAEYGAAHRHQPPELELEPDEEQQHHDPELGYRNDAFRRAEHRKAGRTDDNAGHQVGDDGREPEAARDRHAQDGGGKQHQSKCEVPKFGMLHGDGPRWRRAAASTCARADAAGRSPGLAGVCPLL